MRQAEFHRFTYVNRLGQPRTTRHHLTAEDAAQQLGPSAQILPESTVVRWLRETPAEMARLSTGTGIIGPGSQADEIRALSVQRVVAPLAELAGGDGAVSVDSQASISLDARAE
jgi:hypothetical protein